MWALWVLYQCVACVGPGALSMCTLCVSGQCVPSGSILCVYGCVWGRVLACVLWIRVLSENIMRTPCMWVIACVQLCVRGPKSGCAPCRGKMFLNGV